MAKIKQTYQDPERIEQVRALSHTAAENGLAFYHQFRRLPVEARVSLSPAALAAIVDLIINAYPTAE